MHKYKILVMAQDNIEKPGEENYCWKRGDIVMVRELNHKFSGTEGPPIFSVIEMEGKASENKNLEEHEQNAEGRVIARGTIRYNFDTKKLEVKSR